MAKKVLIVARREVRKNKPIQWVSEMYLDILARAGVQPIIVPISQYSVEHVHDYLSEYDGLLMVEGGDVNPELYGEQSFSKYDIEEFDEVKDSIEFTCCKHALEHNKPILGICRGLHILNVIFGGTLMYDVHKNNNGAVLHINYNNYDEHRHLIRIEKETLLHNWYTSDTIYVTSYHHQGIRTLASGLQPMAYSEDGLVEAVVYPEHSFVVGLQFHPERMYDEYAGNKLVFSKFITEL
ncbi:MAG: gamma-glutamyl-gamma-aminobutyrate hydrolase family protein [Bacteroidota bacterium]